MNVNILLTVRDFRWLKASALHEDSAGSTGRTLPGVRHVRGEGGKDYAWRFPEFCATMNGMSPRFFVIPALLLLAGALSGCGMTTAVRMSDREKIPLARMVEEVKDTPAHLRR